MSWNYRVATEKNSEGWPFRTFMIIEAYYESKATDVPHSYCTFDVLNGWDNYNDLKGTVEMVLSAFNKPILDLDNWPNEYNDR